MSLEEFEFSLEELEQSLHRAGREAGDREEGGKEGAPREEAARSWYRQKKDRVLQRQRRAVIKGNNCEYIL